MIAIMSGLIEALGGLPHEPVAASAGETLFHMGDPVRFIYLVQSGGVHLTRFDIDGGAAVMQRAVAGMILAESSIFSDVYHCDAIAVADARLFRFVLAELLRAAQADPQLMEAIA